MFAKQKQHIRVSRVDHRSLVPPDQTPSAARGGAGVRIPIITLLQDQIQTGDRIDAWRSEAGESVCREEGRSADLRGADPRGERSFLGSHKLVWLESVRVV